MVASGLLTPLVQIGREIRIELALVAAPTPLGRLYRGAAEPLALLPEQRLDDVTVIERRKAEALLQSVRSGAIRR